jgi:N-acylneuraminate cytidylyltransferase
MTALAIILARGGSKGLPRKNARPVAGLPCVLWSLRAARHSKLVSTTFLSTDDPELTAIARADGFEVLARPAALANDSARVDDAARDAVLQYEAAHARLADAAPIVILYGNVPVRPASCIDNALALLSTSGADSVQTYQPVGKHHPWWTARVDAQGAVTPWEGDVLNHGVFRRQDLPPAFIPDGAVIALSRRALMLQIPGVPDGPHAFFGQHRRGIINPEGSVVDIDSHIDMLVAEAMLAQHAKESA